MLFLTGRCPGSDNFDWTGNRYSIDFCFGQTKIVPNTRTGVLAWRVGVTDGGTERPLRRRGRDPGLSRRVPDARGSNLFSKQSERDRDLRLRTTSDTGGSLQGRCDINRRRGVCPLRNIIYFRFPARIPTPRAVHFIWKP